MKRAWKLSLDGTWAFAPAAARETQFDPAKPLPDAQPIAVASYNDQNDQTTALRRHHGWVWYQRNPTLPAFCAGQRVVLRFAAVTHTAKVWLNGPAHCAAIRRFTPFEADVTALLQRRRDRTADRSLRQPGEPQHPACGQRGTGSWPSWLGQRGYPQCGGCQSVPPQPQNRPNFDFFFNYAGIHRPVVLYTT